MKARIGFLAPALVVVVVSLAGCGDKQAPDAGSSSAVAASAASGAPVIAMIPKLVNIDYFDACKRGADQAAKELGVTLIYNGPTEPSGAEQNKFMDTFIRQQVKAICIAPNQPKTIRRFVEKAQAQGIKVITWDSDAPDSGRDLFVDQVDEKVLGERLMDDLATKWEKRASGQLP